MRIFISYRRAEDNKAYIVGTIHEKLARFMENIMPFINQGLVIPIIGNTFRIEQIREPILFPRTIKGVYP